jgi:hypothetical protein
MSDEILNVVNLHIVSFARSRGRASMLARAGAASVVIAACYVGCLFVATRPTDDRNDARVIRRRCVASAVSCACAYVIARCVVGDAADARALGLRPPMGAARAVGWGVAVACAALGGEATRRARDAAKKTKKTGRDDDCEDVWDARRQLLTMRDYVCAPLCEEFCFRACVLATMRGAGASAASASAASALVFAGAHAHHYVGMRARGASVKQAFRACRAQMTFTAVFGVMACRVFSRTESLAATTACHSACNLIGAPSAASFRDARGIAAHVLCVICAMAMLIFF